MCQIRLIALIVLFQLNQIMTSNFQNETISLIQNLVVIRQNTVTIPCHSNYGDYNFRFWILANRDVVGPFNNFNNSKFDYEILSGNLFISVY